MRLLYWGEAELSIMLLRYFSTNTEVLAQDARIPLNSNFNVIPVERKVRIALERRDGKSTVHLFVFNLHFSV
jgi:hypothetical protein